MSDERKTAADAGIELGQPVSDVPQKEPDEYCNARRTSGAGEFEGYCGNPAGQGTEHEGDGRCAECGGIRQGPKTAEGKLVASGNGTTHGMTADPRNYHKRLENRDESEFVIDVSAAIEDRIRENTGDVDYLDRVLARRVAVMIHISCMASEHIGDEGVLERIMTPDGQIEVDNRMLDHFRSYNKDLVRILEKIGATKETQQSGDIVEIWRKDLA